MAELKESYYSLEHCCKHAALALLLFLSVTNLFAQTADSPDSLKTKELYEQAETLFEEARYDSSIALVGRTINYYRSKKQWDRLAGSYNLLSANHRVLNRLDSAETYARNVLQTLEKQSLNLPEERIKAYNNLGLADTERSNFEQAISYYEQALDLAENPAVPSHIYARVLGNMGSVYDDMGKYDQALDYYTQGINLLDRSESKKHKEQLAKLYNYIGITYRKKGQFDKALQFYHQELQINTGLYGEGHPAVAGGYNNIGGIYYYRGDFGEAILYFKKAVASTELIFGNTHPRVGLIYNNIGAVYYEQGDYSKSVEYLKKSAEIKRQSQGENHPDLALTLNNIGSIYTEMGKYDMAVDYLQQSLEIRKETLGETHPILSNNYNALGSLYVNTGDVKSAITHFQRSLDITLKTRSSGHPYAAEARTKLARAYRENGDLKSALSYLQEAEKELKVNSENRTVSQDSKLSMPYKYPNYAVDVLFEKGKTLHARYKREDNLEALKSARATFKELSELLDIIQANFLNEESKLLMGSRSHAMYEEAIEISYELYRVTKNEGYLNDIFFFSEKGKARVILELLNNKRAKKFAGIPDSLLSYETNLREKLSQVQQNLNSELDTDTESENRESLQDSLFKLNRRLNIHMERLRQQYPRYHSFKYHTEVPSHSKVQKSLTEKGITLLHYFYGEDQTWALVMDGENISVSQLSHIPDLSAKVRSFKEAIAQRKDSTYLHMGRELYRALIEPIAGRINTEELLIVPDGPLNLLPFDALLTKEIASGKRFTELPYLLNKHAIRYTPSVSLSSFFSEREMRSYSQRFIGYAPVFSGGTLDILPSVSSRNNWEALPSTRYEVEEIAKSMSESRSVWASLSGRSTTRVLTGAEATEARFKKGALKQYQYLHLATHAFASDTSDGRAGIAFYPDENSGEDGILYSEEIYGLDLSNELVVLSACETGSGEVRAGEGIIGLSRAFQYAGAENLLVSLWNVEDRSTASLMISFYENLQEESGTARALQAAKKTLIQNPVYAHPRYWSPFIHIGN